MRRRKPGEDFSHCPNQKLARRPCKPPRPRDIKSGGGNYGKWKCALAARSILAHYRTNKSDTFILSFHPVASPTFQASVSRPSYNLGLLLLLIVILFETVVTSMTHRWCSFLRDHYLSLLVACLLES